MCSIDVVLGGWGEVGWGGTGWDGMRWVGVSTHLGRADRALAPVHAANNRRLRVRPRYDPNTTRVRPEYDPSLENKAFSSFPERESINHVLVS